jgi:UDP-N-acetylenolpyruvoylglucosamine reductase
VKELIALVRGLGFAGELVAGESLAGHCSLGVGGKAALFAGPAGERDLLALLQGLRERPLPWMVLGGGTNVLFSDRGYPGCIVHLGPGFRRFERLDETLVEAGAAFATPALARWSGEMGLAGLEFAAGIPGTLGGALRMNAGAHGGEMAQTITEVELFHRGRLEWRKRKELAFTDRNLILPSATIITAARFRLAPDEPGAVRARIDALLAKRRASQPRDHSAGCWFKNPPGDSAGRLIDAAGLKGLRVGGAEVSPVHANFLVRSGRATADDFRVLAEKVRGEVARRFGVMLAEEVHVVSG